MTQELMSEVWTVQLTPDQKFILLYLAFIANETGIISPESPEVKKIGHKTGLNKHKVNQLIGELLVLGVLHTIPGSENEYQIDLTVIPSKPTIERGES